ncbi:HAAS signaling domain-containing protein [Bittarella sp. HCP28S3_D9]|uniref:HAAS signaling domain-containing protein n=1 Tax=Bittarella sp. HCP28S3_D9 TaxID=3440253 RepID=UPI003F89E9A8
MKERYIKQVKNQLLLSREAEASVLAGLRESFASAAEYGEGEAETIARLGPPRQFADEVMADLGGESFAAGRRQRAVRAAVLTALFATALLVRTLVGPGLHEQGMHTYNLRPYLLFVAALSPLYYGLAGAVILALPSVWRDLRIRRGEVRRGMGLLCAALFLLLWGFLWVYLLGGFPTYAFSWAATFLLQYPVCFLPLGAGVFAGLNRR